MTSAIPNSEGVARARVLVLVENEPVPPDRRVWLECRALARAGYEVTVICPQGETEHRVEHELVDGVDIYRYPHRAAEGGRSSYLREYGNALRQMRSLARRLAAERPFQVVHLSNPPDVLFLAVLSLKRRGARLVFDHHDLSPELYEFRFRRRGLLYRVAVFFEKLSIRLAEVVISTNESYRRTAIERGGKRPEDVFVVPNAPDLSQFGPGDPDPSLKRGKPHLIAYLGMMAPQDGVDNALRALQVLKERRRDWHAIIAGSGDALGGLKELAAELGLDGLVEFPGYLGDSSIVSLLSTADVCLSPEPKNPLNDASTMVKVPEYMAFARPIVAYDLVQTRATAGDAALYATSGQDASYADCIERLLDDRELRARMGEAGRRRVERDLSWDQSERTLLAAYERVLARP